LLVVWLFQDLIKVVSEISDSYLPGKIFSGDLMCLFWLTNKPHR